MVRSSGLFKKHVLALSLGACASICVVALVTVAPSFATDKSALSNLRGTTDLTGKSTELRSAPLNLRGATETAADYSDAHTSHKKSGFLNDVGSTFLYLRDNIVPVLTFRGSTDAVSERNVTYTLPAKGTLRHSMMHSANVYEGLRGGKASIGDTISTALRGSYSARARLERANVDRARVHGAVANFLPKVEATLSGSRNSISTTSSTNSGSTGDIAGIGVQLTMPLYTSGVNRNLLGQAKHVSAASDYSYLAEEHRVALEAVTAHINLRLNRRVEQILARNVSAMQQIAVGARKLFIAGDTSRTDIAIADANVQSAKAERDLARKSREETQADYESVTGKHAPKRLGSSKVGHLVPASRDDAVAMALQYNPTLAASLHTALASKHAAKAERGRFGPQVSLTGSYNRDLYRSIPSSSDEDWSVGVRLSVPLFDATLAPSVNAAKHEALENGYRALDQSRLVERQIERQWTAYHSANRRLSIVQKQVKAIEKSVNGARREFEAGFRSVTDVLNEQIKLARAQITLETVRHERMLAAYELAFTTANPNLKQLASVSGVR